MLLGSATRLTFVLSSAMRLTRLAIPACMETPLRRCWKSWIPNRTARSRYALLHFFWVPPAHSHVQDHYINVPLDLSQVLFIATANTLDTISAPLLDRCEALRLSGYTQAEKLRIANRYLIPKQLRANGMTAKPDEVKRCEIVEVAVKKVISGYTRESGVRGLERELGAVVRWKAVEWSEAVQAGEPTKSARRAPNAKKGRPIAVLGDGGSAASTGKGYSPRVTEADLEPILGPPRFDAEERATTPRRGVVYGLVVMGEGEGGILPVETALLPGSGNLKLSGSLGDVIRESAELALSWVGYFDKGSPTMS